MENKTVRKLVRTRSEEILLVEHRRAHNICIELAGIRLPFPAIKVPPSCPHAPRLSAQGSSNLVGNRPSQK